MCVAQHKRASLLSKIHQAPVVQWRSVAKPGLYESASYVWKNIRDLAVQLVDFLLRGVVS